MRRLIAFLVAAWTLGSVHAQEIRVEPEVQPDTPAAQAPKAARVAPSFVRNLRLDPPLLADVAKSLEPVETPGVPLQVGIARPVDPWRAPEDFLAELEWVALGDGSAAAAVSITSPTAAALRLGLHVASLPPGAVLRFHGAEGDTVQEVGAAEIARQLVHDDASAPSRAIFWSPVVESETLVMEIALPAGSDPREVRLSGPVVSHLTTSASRRFTLAKAAASCNVDAMCHQGTWNAQSDAVARILFTRDGSTYVCSGTLVSDRDTGTTVPYFLTANHCIPDQPTASTVQAYWFYRSTACNSGARGSFQTRSGGGTLLYGAIATDTALLRLNATPPPGAVYAGWIVGATPATGTAVTGIHHPRGDLQKISFGNIRAYYRCEPTDSGNFSCNGAPGSSASFYGVTWREGVTESGSSGSPIFRDDGRYLLGQLYGGSGSCESPGSDFYGRFDVAYDAAMHRWLGVAGSSSPATPAIMPQHDYTGLWWNPSQSGWGLTLAQHGATIFGAWYVYDAAGQPTWVTMPGGRWTSPTRYSGELYASTGPDPTGFFDPSRVARSAVGTATLDFSSADRGTLAYFVGGASGAIAISRMLFGPFDAAPVAAYGDLWWNAAESGWGLAITQQYRTLFAVWYTYLPDGRATWYVMSGGDWTGPGTYRGTLYAASTAPGPFFAGAFDAAAVSRVPVGSLTLRFSSTGSATMEYVLHGRSGTKSITRLAF